MGKLFKRHLNFTRFRVLYSIIFSRFLYFNWCSRNSISLSLFPFLPFSFLSLVTSMVFLSFYFLFSVCFLMPAFSLSIFIYRHLLDHGPLFLWAHYPQIFRILISFLVWSMFLNFYILLRFPCRGGYFVFYIVEDILYYIPSTQKKK